MKRNRFLQTIVFLASMVYVIPVGIAWLIWIIGKGISQKISTIWRR